MNTDPLSKIWICIIGDREMIREYLYKIYMQLKIVCKLNYFDTLANVNEDQTDIFELLRNAFERPPTNMFIWIITNSVSLPCI